MNQLDAFNDDEIYIARRLVSEYEFVLKKIATTIRIKIYELQNEKFEFSVSHQLKTPIQGALYRTSDPYGKTEREALELALFTTLMFYKEAKEKGHEPQFDWLVENEFF